MNKSVDAEKIEELYAEELFPCIASSNRDYRREMLKLLCICMVDSDIGVAVKACELVQKIGDFVFKPDSPSLHAPSCFNLFFNEIFPESGQTPHPESLLFGYLDFLNILSTVSKLNFAKHLTSLISRRINKVIENSMFGTPELLENLIKVHRILQYEGIVKNITIHLLENNKSKLEIFGQVQDFNGLFLDKYLELIPEIKRNFVTSILMKSPLFQIERLGGAIGRV